MHPPTGTMTMSAKRDWSKVRRKAPKIVNLRLTPEEEAELRQRAEGHGTSVAHYLKAIGLSKPVTVRARKRSVTADVELLRSIHADLGRLAGNSYQIVRGLNFNRQVPEAESLAMLREIRAALKQLRSQLFEALDREP